MTKKSEDTMPLADDGKGYFRIPSMKDQLLFWIVSISCLALDLWSKSAVFNWLESKPNRFATIIDGFLHFVLRENAGAAWSMFAGKRFFLLGVSVLAFVIIVAVFYSGIIRSRYMVFVFSLFFAGVTGNLYDRAFNNGLVRDFIQVDLHIENFQWPTFNVADSLLCISVALMFIHNFTHPSGKEPSKES